MSKTKEINTQNSLLHTYFTFYCYSLEVSYACGMCKWKYDIMCATEHCFPILFGDVMLVA